jgi:uncharacterized OB-fold protein
MMEENFDLFLGVMDLQEAKNHQLHLRAFNIPLEFKTNSKTCTTGCKVTVEVWAREQDSKTIQDHFKKDYLKNLQGHLPDFDALAAVFDPTASEVICQACGTKFAPTSSECPDCGLIY